MYNLYSTIEGLCNSRGIKVSDLSKEIGLHRNVLPRLKANPDKNLSLDTIQKIASYFNVPVDFFLSDGDIDPKDIPPETEISDDQLMFALWKGNPNMTKEDLERVRQFATFMEQERSLK